MGQADRWFRLGSERTGSSTSCRSDSAAVPLVPALVALELRGIGGALVAMVTAAYVMAAIGRSRAQG